MMLVASCLPLPFHFVRWYACQACLCHLLAFYASLHACLHVHAWVLLASVLSILQHNEGMDIGSKPTFVPCGHHLLFVSLLAAFLACLFAISFVCLLASLLLCLPYLSCLFTLCPFAIIYTFSFHCLSTSFLVFAFASTHMERRTHEAGARSPRRKQKRHGCKHLVGVSSVQ